MTLPVKPKETAGTFSLITGENTYASQTAANPVYARRLKSLLPSLTGELLREGVQPKFIDSQLPSPALNFKEFDYNDTSGVVTRFYFAATATTIYLKVGANWVDQGPTFIAAPSLVVIDNLLHASDGAVSYIFDGTSWVAEGFRLPENSPAIDTATAGTLSITTGRFYWWSWADHTVGREHESTSGYISNTTGPQVNKAIKVYQAQGTASTTAGSAAVVGVGTQFLTLAKVGYKFYINGLDFGTIASITDDLNLTLTTVAPSNQAGQHFTIAPARATHWHLYASETENSKVGFLLAEIAIATNRYDDQSPFYGATNSLFTPIKRPKRNDQPVHSRISEIFKDRIWRVREADPRFYVFTAGEEVSAGNNGSPYESMPGTNVSTFSDIVNEDSYPIESNRIRNITAHGEALFIATERDAVPLFGDSIDDFGISQITSFKMGFAGRFSAASTSHGLAFVSYDKKVMLYPSVNGVPTGVDVTSQLLEIGLPIRKTLETIKSSDLDNVRLTWYKYGRRDWLVLSFQDNASAYRTYVYDFDTQMWFELQRGFTALAVWEVSAGNLALVGAATDGYVYVIDDLTGTYVMTGTYPAATWRPALLDFGTAEHNHLLLYVEFELTNSTLAADISVKFWLDPEDVDNLGTPRVVTMSKVAGANRYRGFFDATNPAGTVCQRVLLEFAVAASANAGGFRSVKMKAIPITETVYGL